MKTRFCIFLLLVMTSASVQAQDILGFWAGKYVSDYSESGYKVAIGLNFTKRADSQIIVTSHTSFRFKENPDTIFNAYVKIIAHKENEWILEEFYNVNTGSAKPQFLQRFYLTLKRKDEKDYLEGDWALASKPKENMGPIVLEKFVEKKDE